MADIDAYLEKHKVAAMLNDAVNELVVAKPDDPISFLVDALFREAAVRGQQPVYLSRLLEVRATLQAEQAEAAKVLAERNQLKEQVEKQEYRIKHLLRTLDELEGGKRTTSSVAPTPAATVAASAVPIGHTGFSWSAQVSGVPIGHTSFSWAAGVQTAAPSGASNGAAADETADAGDVSKEAFSQRVSVKRVFKAGKAAVGKSILVSGWARTVRMQKEMAFVEINDGSTLVGLQLVISKKETNGWDELSAIGATGCAIVATGNIVESPGSGQAVELQAESVSVVGVSDGAQYPLAKKAHTLEHLRTLTHLRPRTNTFGAVMRIRNALAYATHTFFQNNGFMYVNSPIITGSDCEGAGEMFQVTTLDVSKPPKTPDGAVDYAQDFFGKQAFLTVSGQLNAEHYACAFGSVYTFGPTFRAEDSNTTRHLAEFWMIEPEIAFADIIDDMNCAESYLRYCIAHVLEHCPEDIKFLAKHYDPELPKTLRFVADTPFARMTYTEAIEVLLKEKNVKWEFPPEWGKELQTEHERYLAETYCKKPLIVYNYPKDCKAFYMRLNDDNKTVAAMDVLFPRLGEMVGGSQREERLDVLLRRMEEMGLEKEGYEAYLDLRRFGTQKHAGFGVGFERLVTYTTGMTNIRDVIPFPRAPGTMAC
uniref:asparagine--tRNA ligase n=1 Tax=Chrysotila carterae TaxID=13221 RepID=A0A7S4C2F7_CHRCT|mmetsp:Transcript_7235/g.16050  ORF Transcript_7235/g.16050 Transcript_7235/m.16050 type:complete len:650 (+) Transcript_7235:42-1991(+)